MTPPETRAERSAPVDAVLSAVADEHRRATLRLLNHSDREAMELDALADRVAHVTTTQASEADHRRRVRIALHQIHLPKLDAYGLLSYDPETKEVRSGADELSAELLAVLDDYEPGE
ncbi:DUF7344 domain-containing protein [Natronomonas amylolytica]|uniref:DUF7344 domain-containing protein n=1 Tax=Natronomonas amylolytica TaxID=3108498 RepID=UPI00300947FA